MEKPNSNPLFKHFRQPAIYLKLPSQGKFYPADSLDISVTGDIPIYPMTVKDELTLKTPDALMNGAGMAEVIRSCCPALKDPWVIPAVDLDAILIAIRLVSYGTNMDITTSCPHCDNSNDHSVNLTTLLENITPVNYNDQPRIDNLIFKLKPQSYRDINLMNIATFEERKLVNNVVSSDLPDDEKKRLFDESFKKITELNISMLISCIENITVDGKTVTDEGQIREFLDNTSRNIFAEIKTKIQELMNRNKIQPIKVVCDNKECAKEYTTDLMFDQANFFE